MLKHLLLFLTFLAFPAVLGAQSPQDDTRDIWDTAFIKKRPAAKVQPRRVRPVRYKVVGKNSIPASNNAASGPALVGVTVWRLRPSKTTDDAEVRQLLHREGEWTPERVGGGTPLAEGAKVQLTIESPRTGYLYVFDRETFADKTFGPPYMIFPTLSLNGGDNKVSAGRVIEIPSSDDKPPFYTLKRSSSNHEGETLTIIVTDKPLTELTIGRNALKISTEQFNSYEKRWGALTQQLELEGGSGSPMNKAEKAARSGKGVLTQEDSLPQTIYRILAKPNQPLLVTIPLSIGEKIDKTN